jgi:hypothetical protein
LKVLATKIAIGRDAFDEALDAVDDIIRTPGVPPGEALIAAGRAGEAEHRLALCEDRLDRRATPGTWGEFLRLRGSVHEAAWRLNEACHDFAQSASVLELVSERYQAALSELALGRLAAQAGARSTAESHLAHAAEVFRGLGARRDMAETAAASALLETPGAGTYVGSLVDADDASVRRLVDAAIMPELLAHETAVALLESTRSDAAVVFVALAGGDVRVLASAGCDAETARALARAGSRGGAAYRTGLLTAHPLGRHLDGDCVCVVATQEPLSESGSRLMRMMATVARQGFELCGARERPPQVLEGPNERPIEPLLPGFVSASAAMIRVTEQIQRLQGHDLTVLITGESGTGKDLVARAIHIGSPRKAEVFLPYNCTTTSRDMADSQLFGHRRGSFTGAVSGLPGEPISLIDRHASGLRAPVARRTVPRGDADGGDGPCSHQLGADRPHALPWARLRVTLRFTLSACGPAGRIE